MAARSLRFKSGAKRGEERSLLTSAASALREGAATRFDLTSLLLSCQVALMITRKRQIRLQLAHMTAI
jgi:hypothetical protein